MNDTTGGNALPKKRGLGRGLDALFGEAKEQYSDNLTGSAAAAPNASPRAAAAPVDASAGTTPAPRANDGGIKRLPITQMVSGKYQPRKTFDEDAIEQLRASIETHGILQPILVRAIAGGKFEIIAGERRWRAAQRVPLHEVPVIIQNLDDRQTLEIALIENLQRADLSALEEAEGYQRLIEEFKYSHDDLAEKIGKSRPHVANMLRLLKLPDSVKKYLHNGDISAGHARALLGAKDAASMAAAIVKKGLSVRAVEQMIKREHEAADPVHQAKQDAKPRTLTASTDANIKALEEAIGNATGLVAKIESRGNEQGRLILEYRSLDEFDLLLEKITR